MFYLAYHLHWSWTEIMNLDLTERRAFVRMLAERIQRSEEHTSELHDRQVISYAVFCLEKKQYAVHTH